jgi:F-type H+-transporting ATPase subunit b
MISIDITMVMHIVNMIVLMVVLNAILYKPILGIIEQRARKIETLDGEVVQFEQRARQRQAELDAKIREASNKAKKALDGARSQAQAVGAEKLAVSRKESDTSQGKTNGRSQVPDRGREEGAAGKYRRFCPGNGWKDIRKESGRMRVRIATIP